MQTQNKKSSVKDWERVLLSFPDKTFFSIMRNYLGEIKTPFNKHDLIRKLANFFSQDVIRNQIKASIDNKDAEILTAIHLLGEPDPDTLFLFFKESIPYLDLHFHLLNLSERLLIYYEDKNSEGSIKLTPLFSSILIPEIINPGVLFKIFQSSGTLQKEPWLSDSFLPALLSALSSVSELKKKDNTLKKSDSERLFRLFPFLKDPPLLKEGPDVKNGRIDFLFRMLYAARMVSSKDGTFLINTKTWMELGEIPAASRWPFLWSCAAEKEPVNISRIRERAEIIQELLANIPETVSFPVYSLKRLLTLFSISRRFPEEENLVDILLLADVFIETEEGLLCKNPQVLGLNPKGTPLSGKAAPERRITVEADFSILMPRDTPYADAFTIAIGGDIVKYDQFLLFEINKSTISRLFSGGITWKQFSDKLEKLTGRPLPQNIQFSGKTWEKEFHSCEFFEGVVLKVSEEKVHIVEHTPSIRRWIKKILAPGVFLLDSEERQGWTAALEEAGIEISAKKGPSSSISISSFIPSPAVKPSTSLFEAVEGDSSRSSRDGGWELHKNTLIDKARLLPFPRAVKNEIVARIEKKLILSTDQLESPSFEINTRQARGLDYIGKIRLIEQALESGSELLEIISRSSEGDPERMLLKPMELEKNGTELYLKGSKFPDHDLQKIKVSKISLVRKLKSSLFAP